ncbi:MAG: M28 family peptidase [Bacteroidota bacterium]
MSTPIRTVLLGLLVLFLWSCKEDKPAPPPPPTNPATTEQTAPDQTIPKFNRDSALQYVADQVALGPRVPNTAEHAAGRDYLMAQLERFGATTSRQDFSVRAHTGTMLNGSNIIGQVNPENPRRILLAAHWDSRHIADSPLNGGDPAAPVDGADDGASGVGVLLEIARIIGQNELDLGVDIVFFDAEDQGTSNDPNTWGLGAQHFARNLPIPRPEYGILLDMVGARGATFPVEGYSRQFAPQIVSKVWRLANQLGYNAYFLNEAGAAITDDHYFINTIAGIPMIDIIHRTKGTTTGFGEHWHTDQDDMDIIDKRTLRAVGQTVLTLLFREASGTI